MEEMKKAKSICRRTGCAAAIAQPGYCDTHAVDTADRFNGLRKAPGSRDFYGSSKWKQLSKSFRQAHPLCVDHHARGVIVKGALVDHIIERNDLINQGKSPFDWEYLQTLCHACHNRKLSTRRVQAKPVTQQPLDTFAMYADAST